MKDYIRIEDMTMVYNDKPVVWNVNLNIPKNSRTVIIGPNGAGKSTLIKGVLNLIKPLTGRVLIDDVKINKKIIKTIAYIPQVEEVNWDFPTTVFEVVLMGRYPHLGYLKHPGKKDKDIARKAIEKMKMSKYINTHISELSGGQKQRVFLARAIAQNAPIYFMDEPFQGVDIQTEKMIAETIKQFQKEEKTVIVVHHNLDTVKEYFDYVVMMNKTIVCSGPVSSTFTKENIKDAYRGNYE